AADPTRDRGEGVHAERQSRACKKPRYDSRERARPRRVGCGLELRPGRIEERDDRVEVEPSEQGRHERVDEREPRRPDLEAERVRNLLAQLSELLLDGSEHCGGIELRERVL